MPKNRNVRCDQCRKSIGSDKNAWFSNQWTNLDFCSKKCYSEWMSNKTTISTQEWLNQQYPQRKKRKYVTDLNISNKNLEGSLDLSDFINLEKLICSQNQLTELNLSNCQKLEKIDCSYNQLTSLDLSNTTQLREICCQNNQLTSISYPTSNPEKLTVLSITNNNLTEQNISVFSKFINLQSLLIGSSFQEEVKENIYNRFYGSSESLKDLNNLKYLHLSNTDLEISLEQLPKSVEEIYCSSKERPESKVKKITEEAVKDSNNFALVGSAKHLRSEAQKWLNKHHSLRQFEDIKKIERIDLSDLSCEGNLDLVEFNNLREINIGSNFYLLEKIKPSLRSVTYPEDRMKIRMKAQEWLNWKHPNKQEVKAIISDWCGEYSQIYDGELIIDDYPQLTIIDIMGSASYDGESGIQKITKLQVSNCSQLVRLWFLSGLLNELTISNCSNLNALQIYKTQLAKLDLKDLSNLESLSINQNLSLSSLNIRDNKKIKSLDVSDADLDSLDVSHLIELEWLTLENNEFTELNVSSLSNLKTLKCGKNLLTKLDLAQNEKLEELSLDNNNFSEQNLSFLSHLVNLKHLYLGNTEQERIRQGIYNRFYGSLKPLKNMDNLESLNISNTDIDNGLKYLPTNVKNFCCLADHRKGAKTKIIYDLFADEQGKVEVERYGYIKDFSKKLPTAKQKIQAQELLEDELSDKEKQTDSKVVEGVLISEDAVNKKQQNDPISSHSIEQPTKTSEEKSGLQTREKQIFGDDSQVQTPSRNLITVTEIEIQNDSTGQDLEEIQKKQEKITNLQWQITTERPTLERVIGKGGYGKVYYGKWKLQDVAVKELYLSLHNTSESDIKDIKKEINVLKDLRNRYIIQYYGVYSDGHDFFIIMDYAENGTLTKFINDNKNKEYDWNFNTNLIKQMTLGLAYIHHENIIHRDLKSLNILLDKNFQVKISDFGLSKTKITSSSQSKNNTVGTLRWMAPEIISNSRNPNYSEQSDIYALGMVIWEIAAKCVAPFKDIDNSLIYVCVVINGEKETIPDDTPQNIRDIIEGCWKSKPDERISLKRILEIIEDSQEQSSIQAQVEQLPK